MKPENDILKFFGLDDAELEKFLSDIKDLRVPAKTTKDDAWNDFESRLETKINSKKIRHLNAWAIRIAASIALLFALGYITFNYWNQVKIVTQTAEIKNIELPDGSKIALNAGSEFKYQKWNWLKNRKVQLSGEAFFSVTKGNSFEVIANSNTVKVLGTEFNVSRRNGFFEVKCKSGRVEVLTEKKNKHILGAGQAVRETKPDSRIDNFSVKTEEIGSWQEGQFYFENSEINTVFQEIERQFGVTIKSNIKNRFYTGYFNNSNLQEALNNVCLPMGLTFSMNEKTVEIKEGN